MFFFQFLYLFYLNLNEIILRFKYMFKIFKILIFIQSFFIFTTYLFSKFNPFCIYFLTFFLIIKLISLIFNLFLINRLKIIHFIILILKFFILIFLNI